MAIGFVSIGSAIIVGGVRGVLARRQRTQGAQQVAAGLRRERCVGIGTGIIFISIGAGQRGADHATGSGIGGLGVRRGLVCSDCLIRNGDGGGTDCLLAVDVEGCGDDGSAGGNRLERADIIRSLINRNDIGIGGRPCDTIVVRSVDNVIDLQRSRGISRFLAGSGDQQGRVVCRHGSHIARLRLRVAQLGRPIACRAAANRKDFHIVVFRGSGDIGGSITAELTRASRSVEQCASACLGKNTPGAVAAGACTDGPIVGGSRSAEIRA